MDLLGKDFPVLLGLVTGAIGIWLAATRESEHSAIRKVGAMLTIATSVLSFTAQIVQVHVNAQSAQQRKLAEASRDTILGEIRGNVRHTAGVVDEISERLKNVSPGQVGEQLVSVSASGGDVDRMLAYGKGRASDWKTYRDWLAARNPRAQTALSFEVNAGNHYVLHLTLAYLLTSPRTATELSDVVERPSSDWIKRPFVDRALLDWSGVDYVIFRDGKTRQIVAYGPARDFARDLTLRARTEGAAEIEAALNRPQEDVAGVVSALERLSPSIRTSVTATADVASVVKVMLEKRWTQCVMTTAGQPYLVSLEKMVRVAAGES